MKKALLVLLCCAMFVGAVSCDIENERDNLDTYETNASTTASNTTNTVTTCAHIFSEWSISKEATERIDGEATRACSRCHHIETKIIHAKGTEGLLFTLSEDGASYSVSAGTATSEDVFIPAYHNGLPVTRIGYIGFANSDDEPENLEVGTYAFFSCSDLKTVVIPSTVTVIGDSAFMMCESLERIVIPESVKEIGEHAFVLTEEDLYPKYYDDIKVSIPNTQVILVLREWSFLVANGVEIYYLDENGNEILIADTYFIDEYCSFDKGYFEIINNNDNTFSVRAGDSENKDEWIEKAFDIPQCVSVFVPKTEAKFTVFYGGNSSEEWGEIDISEGNKKLGGSVIYYYSETEPSESNKYWHYVDGIPTLW